MLIVGPTEDDQAYAEALRRAANVSATASWWKSPGASTTTSAAAPRRMPLFTQAAEYDVVLVADERGDFGEYVPYQTWLPRPVAGTQGLTARLAQDRGPMAPRSCRSVSRLMPTAG